MIRRRVGDEFWLIPQHDHALLSGELAKHLGNSKFAKPQAATAVLGISLHDCGWPIHDDRPTLNRDRSPIDVFETTLPIGLNVWTESAKRAAERDPYAGLLVSLHGLNLSAMATSQVFDNENFDINDTRVRFEVNKSSSTRRSRNFRKISAGNSACMNRHPPAAGLGGEVDRSKGAGAGIRFSIPPGDGQAEPVRLLHQAAVRQRRTRVRSARRESDGVERATAGDGKACRFAVAF